MTLRLFVWILLLAAGLAAALWWNRDQPAVQRLWPALGSARTALPGLPDLRSATPRSAGTLRKCRSAGQVLYTDGSCPPGSREEAADGGTVTVLPAAPVAPAAAAAPASVQTPLRRLAGEGGAPDQQERRVEQALNR